MCPPAPGQDARFTSFPSDFILLLPACPATWCLSSAASVSCCLPALRSADQASRICGSALQTSLSRDKGQRAPLNGERAILHWAAGWATLPPSVGDSASRQRWGGRTAGLEAADLVPSRSEPGGVGITEVPAAALGERRCVISATWPRCTTRQCLRARTLDEASLCPRPAATTANDN